MDTDWQVIPNLWGGIIAPPGFKKSNLLKAVIAPIQEIERQHEADYKEAMEDYEKEHKRNS
jgi:hypothetical protein